MELLASLLELLSADADEEQSSLSDTKKMALVCVGWLAYCAPMEGEARDLWRVMDGQGTVGRLAAGAKGAEARLLVREVGGLLTG